MVKLSTFVIKTWRLMMEKINVALPKGRLGEKVYSMFEAVLQLKKITVSLFLRTKK